MEDVKDTVIYWPAVRIIAHPAEWDMKEVLVDIEKLKWNAGEDEYPYLSLSEISDQLQNMGYTYPFYVWEESGLSGQIYLYGNYEPNEWQEHGTTKGYA